MGRFCVRCGTEIDEETNSYPGSNICLACAEKSKGVAVPDKEQKKFVSVTYHILMLLTLIFGVLMVYNYITFLGLVNVNNKNADSILQYEDGVFRLMDCGYFFYVFTFFIFGCFIASLAYFDKKNQLLSVFRVILSALPLIICIACIMFLKIMGDIIIISDNSFSIPRNSRVIVLFPIFAFIIFFMSFIETTASVSRQLKNS